MATKRASKEYLAALYERKPVSICMVCTSGQESRYMDYVSRITAKGIETGRGGYYSKKTGYAMGPGAPEATSYIEEYFKLYTMSSQVSLVMYTGLREYPFIEELNYTDNFLPMLRLALPMIEGLKHGLNWLEGMRANSCIWHLREAIHAMEANPSEHRALEPSNGYGTYEDCLGWLRNILTHCEQHPLAILRIS